MIRRIALRKGYGNLEKTFVPGTKVVVIADGERYLPLRGKVFLVAETSPMRVCTIILPEGIRVEGLSKPLGEGSERHVVYLHQTLLEPAT